jgi:hypothetical protein
MPNKLILLSRSSRGHVLETLNPNSLGRVAHCSKCQRLEESRSELTPRVHEPNIYNLEGRQNQPTHTYTLSSKHQLTPSMLWRVYPRYRASLYPRCFGRVHFRCLALYPRCLAPLYPRASPVYVLNVSLLYILDASPVYIPDALLLYILKASPGYIPDMRSASIYSGEASAISGRETSTICGRIASTVGKYLLWKSIYGTEASAICSRN